MICFHAHISQPFPDACARHVTGTYPYDSMLVLALLSCLFRPDAVAAVPFASVASCGGDLMGQERAGGRMGGACPCARPMRAAHPIAIWTLQRGGHARGGYSGGGVPPPSPPPPPPPPMTITITIYPFD